MRVLDCADVSTSLRSVRVFGFFVTRETVLPTDPVVQHHTTSSRVHSLRRGWHATLNSPTTAQVLAVNAFDCGYRKPRPSECCRNGDLTAVLVYSHNPNNYLDARR